MPTFPRGHTSRRSNGKNARLLASLGQETPLTQLSEAIQRHRTILQLISRDGDHCYICNRCQPADQYEIDHIIARSLGGPNNLTNYALTCKSCNCRKHDRAIAFTINDRTPILLLAQ